MSQSTAVLRIRLFEDDLGAALELRRRKRLAIESASSDSVFLAYFRDHFELRTNEETLFPRLVGAGNDRAGSEPVVWYMLRFDAGKPIGSVHISNRVLMELFDDQRNVLNIVHVPTEQRRVFYFAAGDEEVEFDIGR